MINNKLTVDHDTDLETRHGGMWDRRAFVKGVSALVGSAGLLGYDMKPAAAGPPVQPEAITLNFPEAYVPGKSVIPDAAYR